jgi:hypothetical protein
MSSGPLAPVGGAETNAVLGRVLGPVEPPEAGEKAATLGKIAMPIDVERSMITREFRPILLPSSRNLMRCGM